MQCDDSVTYFSGKAEFTDRAGKVDRSKEGKMVVKVTRPILLLCTNDDENDRMTGAITDRICEWKEPFKNGNQPFPRA